MMAQLGRRISARPAESSGVFIHTAMIFRPSSVICIQTTFPTADVNAPSLHDGISLNH
jgi:hypothetical protein